MYKLEQATLMCPAGCRPSSNEILICGNSLHDGVTGRGRKSHPYTGWSSLVVLMMGEI